MNIIIPKISEKTIELPKRDELLKGILLAALARSQLPGMYPLGIAFAAVFPAESAYIGLIGLCIGMAGAKLYALKYILSFFIYYILVFLRKAEDESVKAVALGVSLLFSGLVSFLWTGVTVEGLLLLLPEVIAAGCAFRLFTHIGEKSDMGSFALLLAAGGVLNGLNGIVLPYINMNLSVFAAFFMAMSLCYALELPAAVLGSAVLGFMMYMNDAQAVVMAGTFALAAVFSSLLTGMGKIGTAVGFLCGLTLSALYSGNLSYQIIDIFMPLAIFAILPEGLHYRIGDAVNGIFEPEYEQPKYNVRIANQLKTVAKAVCDLADGVTFLSGGDKDSAMMKEMFDTIASRVCCGCSLEGNCWKKDSKKTYNNMYELWRTMETDGFCDYTNMPLAFRQICIRSESFLCEFNHVYELYKQNALYRGEALSGRDIIARQYMQISNVINLLSHEVEMGLDAGETPDLRYRVSIAQAQEPKNGQAVCGDTLVHFEKDGKYFVILCDGMGSGESALSESRLTARLFSEFLKAGFEKETALNMINSALALKADQESFSTVDLLEINLETGVAEFLKIGSAQSFLKTKSNIEVISSKALPVGILENVEVSAERYEMRNNDVILMVSDGVGEAGSGVLKNDWIKKLMMMENRNDEELAKLILVGAKVRMKFSDDISAVVIRIKRKRSEQNEYSK